MKKFAIFASALALSFPTFADGVQKAIEKASRPGLRVYELSRSKETTGNVETTTVEFMFENTTDRTMESDFEFPLDDGESVCGYALDINGKMRNGVVVEKDKGRQVFESIVRRGVDPGIVEMTAGNNFRTRVYPITPHGVRHLQITVEKELSGDEAKAEIGKVYTQTVGKNTFFYYYGAISDMENQKKSLPKKIAVWWDISASGENRDINAEIGFLERYVASLSDPEVVVAPFCNDVHEAKVFHGNSKTALKELSDFLRSLTYDGATNLSIDFSSIGGDEAFVFSDGLSNWGLEESVEVAQKIPVNAVCSSESADFSRLKKISRYSGGEFVNLRTLGEEKSISLLTDSPIRLLDAQKNDAEISELYGDFGKDAQDGFSVAGILKKKRGKVVLNFGRGGNVEKQIEFSVSSVGTQDSQRIERLWAKKKIAFLGEDFEKNRTQIIELAKAHTIVTEGTSLIVLENVSDYVRYEIEPPEELRAEYDRLVSIQMRNKTQNDESIPQAVFRKFEEFKNWWKKSPLDWKKAEDERKQREAEAAAKRNAVTANRLRGRVSNDAEMAVESMEMMEDSAAAPMMMAEAPMASRAVAPMASAKMAGSENAKSAPVRTATTNANQSAQNATIELRAWESGADYLSVLKKTAEEEMFGAYILLKKEWKNSPAFYLEVSDYFEEEGLHEESVRILSNLAEMNLENTDVLRAGRFQKTYRASSRSSAISSRLCARVGKGGRRANGD